MRGDRFRADAGGMVRGIKREELAMETFFIVIIGIAIVFCLGIATGLSMVARIKNPEG